MEPVFSPLNMQEWPLAQSFYYYTQMAPTTYSVNVSVDVTNTRKVLKDNGLKFFPAYLHIVTKAIGEQRELRIAKQEDAVGYWNCLTPAYPQFHEDDKTTSLLWTEYDDDFRVFHARYIDDTAKHGASHGIVSSKGIPPRNAYIISCLPWFTFNSFSLHNHGIKDYFFPSLEAGRFVENAEKIIMPLSVTVHHATTEGYHLKLFFEQIQHLMNEPLQWL